MEKGIGGKRTGRPIGRHITIQQFADMVRDDAKPRGRIIYAGEIPPEIRRDYESKGLRLESNEVLIDDAAILKYISHPKEAKGAVIDKDRYDEVAQVISNPTHIYEDLKQKGIIYTGTRNYSTGKVLKVAIHPNYKRKRRVYNLVKHIGVVNEDNMKDVTQYRQIK